MKLPPKLFLISTLNFKCLLTRPQDDVLELNALLSRWPVLPAERALQLLDYAYPDEHVRKFAVK